MIGHPVHMQQPRRRINLTKTRHARHGRYNVQDDIYERKGTSMDERPPAVRPPAADQSPGGRTKPTLPLRAIEPGSFVTKARPGRALPASLSPLHASCHGPYHDTAKAEVQSSQTRRSGGVGICYTTIQKHANLYKTSCKHIHTQAEAES